MKPRKTLIPYSSSLSQYLPFDYVDCFACNLPGNCIATPSEIMSRFWKSMPVWAKFLLWVRNVIVAPFGLKTSKDVNLSDVAIIGPDTDTGLYSAVFDSETERIIKLSDKHLTAYFSVLCENAGSASRLYISTAVKFHIKLGRLYFFVIRPFHSLIVKSMVKRVCRNYR